MKITNKIHTWQDNSVDQVSWYYLYFISYIYIIYSELSPPKKAFFKEQNAGFCAQLHIWWLWQNTVFFKRHVSCLLLSIHQFKGIVGNFFFVKSLAIVSRWKSKNTFLAWDFFWVCFDHFHFFQQTSNCLQRTSNCCFIAVVFAYQ